METVKTNIGEVTVKQLTVIEGRELMVYMALINQEKLDTRIKAKKVTGLYFERLMLATGKTLKELGKLDQKSLNALDEVYNRLNNIEGGEAKDF